MFVLQFGVFAAAGAVFCTLLQFRAFFSSGSTHSTGFDKNDAQMSALQFGAFVATGAVFCTLLQFRALWPLGSTRAT